jgi:hypothetical protein
MSQQVSGTHLVHRLLIHHPSAGLREGLSLDEHRVSRCAAERCDREGKKKANGGEE